MIFSGAVSFESKKKKIPDLSLPPCTCACKEAVVYLSMDKCCIVVKVKISFFNPNLGGLVGNMTNGCVKFISHAKKCKKM
jgi:hypothetical protein